MVSIRISCECDVKKKKKSSFLHQQVDQQNNMVWLVVIKIKLTSSSEHSQRSCKTAIFVKIDVTVVKKTQKPHPAGHLL